ncbi:hypothetical protein AJ78_02320 [Emergomyces pasteurianus Ep9510]|uniref:Uncharacterized protein n=1 Tax=Emergomyces pasteurianus Ep9510 TaxID=1447872 RepID=A0A1J9PMA5_9EURO|nr:hypothetical protein AJ78_02320 [Emergomyces pasteurianus Ep9510]
MAAMSNLGSFSRLPYELREQIWAELAPTPAQHMSNHENSRKTDLSILRANHILHDEIDEVIYRRCTLEFDIDPVYQPAAKLCSVSFRRKHRLINRGDAANACPASWSLDSIASAKARGFGSIAFHKFDQVVVNIPSPDPNDMGELFCLWEKVRGLVSLFSGGTQIKNLLIRLQERKSDGQNWIDNLEWPSKAYTPSPVHSTCQHDHDVPILPFCTLRNLMSLQVETYSEEFAQLMDWGVIDAMVRLVRDANSRCDDATGRDDDKQSVRAEVERRAAFEYYWMHALLWTYVDGGKTANIMRRETLRKWARDGSETGFEKEIRRIMRKYPAFLSRQSAHVLRDMHCVAVCLKHAVQRSEAMLTTSASPSNNENKNNNGKDDEREEEEEEEERDDGWNALFPAGLPVVATREFDESVGQMVMGKVYQDSVRVDEMSGSFDRLLRKWEHGCRRSIWWYLKRNVFQHLGVSMRYEAWYM